MSKIAWPRSPPQAYPAHTHTNACRDHFIKIIAPSEARARATGTRELRRASSRALCALRCVRKAQCGIMHRHASTHRCVPIHTVIFKRSALIYTLRLYIVCVHAMFLTTVDARSLRCSVRVCRDDSVDIARVRTRARAGPTHSSACVMFARFSSPPRGGRAAARRARGSLWRCPRWHVASGRSCSGRLLELVELEVGHGKTAQTTIVEASAQHVAAAGAGAGGVSGGG